METNSLIYDIVSIASADVIGYCGEILVNEI
jgi:hypothetical protein